MTHVMQTMLELVTLVLALMSGYLVARRERARNMRLLQDKLSAIQHRVESINHDCGISVTKLIGKVEALEDTVAQHGAVLEVHEDGES